MGVFARIRQAAAARRRVRSLVAAANPRRPRSIGVKNLRTGGLLGIETKFFDVPRTNTDITAPTDASGGEINPSSICTGCLSAPAQGDGPTNRDGMKIAMKSILIKGAVTISAQSTQSTLDNIPAIFLALILDTQTNGATYNSEDVFTNPAATASNNASLLRNMSYTERFKVLKTLVIRPPPLSAANDTGSTGGLVQQGCVIPFTLSKSLGGLNVKFTSGSTTADVANVIDNSLHLCAFSTDSTDSLNIGINFNSRLRFLG